MDQPGKKSNLFRLLPATVLGLHLFLYFVALLNKSYLTDDSIQYLNLSNNMVTWGIFSQSPEPPIIYDVQRTPGYSFFLMMLGDWIPAVLAVQHLLVLATGFLIFRIMRTYANLQLSAALAWIFLLMPYPAVFASMILSESLFLFLLIASLWGMNRYLRGQQKFRDIGFAMFTLAMAVYVRPTAMPLAGLYLIASFWGARRLSWFSLSLRTLGPAIFFALLILPWNLRNYGVSGRFMFSSMGDMAIVQGRMGGMIAWENELPYDDHTVFMATDSVLAKEIGLANIREYYSSSQSHETELLTREARSTALGYIARHPILFAEVTGLSFVQMFSGSCYGWTAKVTDHRGIALVLAILSMILTHSIWLISIFALTKFRQWSIYQWVLFFAAWGMLFVSAAIWADGRYRFPSDAVALLLAGAYLAERFKPREVIEEQPREIE